MGFYRFPTPGHDTAGGVTTWAAGCAPPRHERQARATWAKQERCRDTLFSVVTWFGKIGIATHFLVSRHGSGNLVSRHGLIFLVSRPIVWCRYPQFGVATWSSLIGVAT